MCRASGTARGCSCPIRSGRTSRCRTSPDWAGLGLVPAARERDVTRAAIERFAIRTPSGEAERRQPVGRQPAEGGARPMDGRRSEDLHFRGSDARGRCRHKARDLSPHPRAGRGRGRGDPGLVRPSRTDRACRPHSRLLARAHRRRNGRRRGHRRADRGQRGRRRPQGDQRRRRTGSTLGGGPRLRRDDAVEAAPLRCCRATPARRCWPPWCWRSASATARSFVLLPLLRQSLQHREPGRPARARGARPVLRRPASAASTCRSGR